MEKTPNEWESGRKWESQRERKLSEMEMGVQTAFPLTLDTTTRRTSFAIATAHN